MLKDMSAVWNCVTEIRDTVMLMRLERSVNRRGVLAAAIPTRMMNQALNCSRNRPLLVSFFADRTIQQSLVQV
jgi:hypothetical protein